jgi:hypothetical protein
MSADLGISSIGVNPSSGGFPALTAARQSPYISPAGGFAHSFALGRAPVSF